MAGSCRELARVTSALPSARARARRKFSPRSCTRLAFSRYREIRESASQFFPLRIESISQECMCCRESFLREKTVTLTHCYDSSGARITGRNASLDVKLREPADCKCFRCGESSE